MVSFEDYQFHEQGKKDNCGNNFHETTSVACATYFSTCVLQALATYIYIHTTGEIMAKVHMEERFSIWIPQSKGAYVYMSRNLGTFTIPTLYQLFMKAMQ